MATSPADGGDPDQDQAGQHSPGRLLDLHRGRQLVNIEALRVVPAGRRRRRRAALGDPLASMSALLPIWLVGAVMTIMTVLR